jgi:putative tricarboxylic transport membrane protein
MARQGRAGAALGISAFGSFIAGTIGVIGLMLLAPPLARFALRFGPPEIFALVVLAFALVGYLASRSMVKALMMAVLGLLLASVGIETISAKTRFAFGSLNLQAGIDMVPLIMGLFGLAESSKDGQPREDRCSKFTPRFWDLFPNRQDWKNSVGPIGRGSLLGFLIGILPGDRDRCFLLFLCDREEAHKNRERFGQGAIEEWPVRRPPTTRSPGAYVPLLTLGIPGNAAIALTLGALQIHGVIPGPLLIRQHPEVFWEWLPACTWAIFCSSF